MANSLERLQQGQDPDFRQLSGDLGRRPHGNQGKLLENTASTADWRAPGLPLQAEIDSRPVVPQLPGDHLALPDLTVSSELFLAPTQTYFKH